MVATLPNTLASGHEPSGIEISQLLDAAATLSNYKLFAPGAGACTIATTSGAFVYLPNAAWAFNKLRDLKDSDVLILLALNSFTSAVPNFTSFAILDLNNNQTYDTHFKYFNTASHHDWSWGLSRISNLSPGNHIFQVMLKTSGGTATLNADNSVISLTLEIPL